MGFDVKKQRICILNKSETGSTVHAPGTEHSASAVCFQHTRMKGCLMRSQKCPNVCQQSLINTVDVIDHSIGS